MIRPRRTAGPYHPMGGAMDVLARTIVLSGRLNHYRSIWTFPANLGPEAEDLWISRPGILSRAGTGTECVFFHTFHSICQQSS